MPYQVWAKEKGRDVQRLVYTFDEAFSVGTAACRLLEEGATRVEVKMATEGVRYEIWGREKDDKVPVLLYSFSAEEADSVEDVAEQLRGRGVTDVTVKEVKG